MIALFEEVNKLIEKVKMDFSVQEERVVGQTLVKRAILSPKSFIKDHKTVNESKFTTRLVLPATKCTAKFSYIGYLGIKIMLDKANVNYSCFTIFQAYEPKERLE